MKTLLVTGASGFLGKVLLTTLSNNPDYKVIALSTNPDKISYFSSDRIRIEHADFIFSVRECGEEIYSILNLAYPRVGKNVYGGHSYIENVLKVASESGNVRSLVNISSQSVYDPLRTMAATENTQIVLDSTYALGKYAMERLTNCVCRDIPHTNIRLASLIGPEFDQRIVNRFINNVFTGEAIKAEISKQTFGFFDVRDAAAGLLHLVDTPFDRWKEVYNLGNGECYSIRDILDSIIDVVKAKGLIMPDVIVENTDKEGCTGVAGKLFTTDTGFEPQYSLEDSIGAIIDYNIGRNV